MGRTVRIMPDKEKLVGQTSDEQHQEVLEEAASLMIGTLPNVFRTLKQKLRIEDDDGHERSGGSGLGGSQIGVLHMLAFDRQLTSEMARRFNVATPTMTRIVDSLVDKGYVERQPDPKDRRQIYLQLTESGRQAAEEAQNRFCAAIASFLSPLSEEQLSEIVLACRHLRSLLPEGAHGYERQADFAEVKG
jgi:DNA-binding MarR family transcriptional regulator